MAAQEDIKPSELAAEIRESVRQEKIANALDEEWQNNDEILRIAEESYLKELGSLKNVFEILSKHSKNLKVSLKSSYTGAEFGNDREKFLSNFSRKMQDSLVLPTYREIERVWYENMFEMWPRRLRGAPK